MDNTPDPLRAAVEAAGGTSAVARKLKVSKQRLDNWLKRGAPWKVAPDIEKHLGVPRQVLRPHDWKKHWPALAKRIEKQERAPAGG